MWALCRPRGLGHMVEQTIGIQTRVDTSLARLTVECVHWSTRPLDILHAHECALVSKVE